MTHGFRQIESGALGLPASDDHLSFEWMNPECRILFSVCRQGNAASCHFASDKDGLRDIKQAINEWVKFAFFVYGWCDMILAKISVPSVERLVKKCGFSLVAKTSDGKVRAWARCK